MSTLNMARGDDRVIEFTVYDEDNQPLDLTDYDLLFVARRFSWDSPRISKTLDDGIVLGIATGVAYVAIDSADTSSLDPISLRWLFKVIDSTGKVFTVATGFLKIE